MIPLGAVIQIREVGRIALLLVSDKSRFVEIADIFVDSEAAVGSSDAMVTEQ
jgi:enoyl-[acyl-carrier-protein] reductase (NADH)